VSVKIRETVAEDSFTEDTEDDISDIKRSTANISVLRKYIPKSYTMNL
jgi:hypothetical protein